MTTETFGTLVGYPQITDFSFKVHFFNTFLKFYQLDFLLSLKAEKVPWRKLVVGEGGLRQLVASVVPAAAVQGGPSCVFYCILILAENNQPHELVSFTLYSSLRLDNTFCSV